MIENKPAIVPDLGNWKPGFKDSNGRPNSEGYYYLRADLTVRNRTKDYWYAYRKVNGVQRTFYLGKTADLDYEKLQQAVDELSLSQMEYQKLMCDRKSGVQNKVYISSQATDELSSPQSISSPLGCIQEELYTLTQTNEQLQIEIDLLNKKLAVAEGIVAGLFHSIFRAVFRNLFGKNKNLAMNLLLKNGDFVRINP